MKILGLDIEWLGHDSFKILSDKIIYIDPFKIEANGKADLILITHEHYDHFSIEDINKIKKDSTIIIAPVSLKEKLPEARIMKPGECIEVDKVKIEAVPAYNLDKPYHKQLSKYLGYILTINNKKIYHAGDTDLIPEMNHIEADIALLPVSGKYVMDAEEAANAANLIRPEVAIPMHYGSIIGTKEDAIKFKSLVDSDIQVVIF